jgi:membrane protein DedA with SNARE-associated domain
MAQWLLSLATQYGYVIVFAGVMAETTGVPLPGETVLLVGAVLAAQGRLNPAAVAAVGWVAAFAGPCLGYWLGRHFGERLLQLRLVRRFYRPRHVAAAERFFERHGVWTVFVGRFVAFLRILIGPLAGIHRMRFWPFLAANVLGGAIWVAAVVSAGMLLGGNLDRAAALLSRIGYAGLALIAVLAVGLLAAWRMRRSRRQNEG